MRGEQKARDDEANGDAESLHPENGGRRRAGVGNDDDRQDDQHDLHDQRGTSAETDSAATGLEQAGRQAGDQLETAAKREEQERDADAGDRGEAGFGQQQEACEQDGAGDEDALLDPAPQPADRNRQAHGVERGIDKGRARQDVHGGQAERNGEERQQEIDDQQHCQVGREGRRREDEQRGELDAESQRARRYRQRQRARDAGRQRIGQSSRRGRRRNEAVTQSGVDGPERAGLPRNPGG